MPTPLTQIKKGWEHFSHDADVGIRGTGSTIEETFEMAALALTNVVTSPDNITPKISLSVHCFDTDVETLSINR